ncbi:MULTISPECIES: hypothetical protein [Streptomyces violaceusniger group]|uniref:Uncharacterized protein n=2 Tax=Streptomyces rhizosphaericus TaxID=114699 RepID=A0ABN1S770_9ACTN|nr:hypothetical protein [Streptomyces indonesiensis]
MLATVPSSAGFGVAELQLDIDDAEHDRRHAAGLGVATGHGFGGLDVLMALPHGLPVPLEALTDHQRAYIHRAPAGICTVTDGQVVRHVTRPCQVQLATVRAASASQLALNAAEKFTTFCARRVIITRTPSVNYPEKLLEFGYYGIGVSLQHPDGHLETLVAPRPWRPQRHTPEAWWFAETAYGQFLAQQSSPHAPTLSPAP